MPLPEINVFWFRRDLRLHDNHGFFQALTSGVKVLPIFIFDQQILGKLSDPADLRVNFIHRTLNDINRKLHTQGSAISVFFGTPQEIFKRLLTEYDIKVVFANHDDDPYAINRDQEIQLLLESNGIGFQTYKDHVIFERKEVTKDDGMPYTVFTPYSRKWKAALQLQNLKTFPSQDSLSNLYPQNGGHLPSLASMGFKEIAVTFPISNPSIDLIAQYDQNRNFPSLPGTSKLGVHLRFGTISIREWVSIAGKTNETFLNELIWREFYHMILANFPHVGQGKSFKADYDLIEWRNDESDFDKWCRGETGYPIVDAGMRELNTTGFMHNRVRMITASFLTKHLLIDWRWGEAWFASKLMDFDLAANNGGWQWAAGSGCDAAPYFRVFNPTLQTQKFDPRADYIKKWVPEFEEFGYPKPMVIHEFARKRCLETYAKYLRKD